MLSALFIVHYDEGRGSAKRRPERMVYVEAALSATFITLLDTEQVPVFAANLTGDESSAAAREGTDS